MTAAPASSTAPTSTATPNRQERVDGDLPSVGLAAAWALGGCLGVSLPAAARRDGRGGRARGGPG